MVNYLTSPKCADMANAETNGGLCTLVTSLDVYHVLVTIMTMVTGQSNICSVNVCATKFAV